MQNSSTIEERKMAYDYFGVHKHNNSHDYDYKFEVAVNLCYRRKIIKGFYKRYQRKNTS